MKLHEVLPREFMGPEYDRSEARKFAHEEVESEHNFNWPGKERNVAYWVTLKNGHHVGWNENPGRGWSFPVIKNHKK